MRHLRSTSQSGAIQRSLYSLFSFLFVLLFATSLGWAQPAKAKLNTKKDKVAAGQPNLDELNKYPGLLEEYGRLLTRLQREIKMPPVRSQSHLLRVMPESTIAFGAFPNYGAAVRQAMDIFHQELKVSTPLRNWWQHNRSTSKGPDVEMVLGKYSQLSEFLGDEVVTTGTIKQDGGGLMMIAEVKKPGLEAFLRSAVKELAGKSTPPQVLNVNELATASAKNEVPVILIRPDLVILSSDLKTLRTFNAKLGSGGPTLDSTDFGQRLSQSYQKGVEVLLAADLQKLLNQFPQRSKQEQLMFQRTGISNAQYAIWEYADVNGQAPSQAELSFVGARTGIASWLAAPAHLSGLDFVSTDAAMVMSVLLKDPPEILADIESFTGSPNSADAQKLANLEPVLKPILSQLTGDITLELDAFPPASAEWKVILGAKDVKALQQALSPILVSLQPRSTVVDGETYFLARVPNASKPIEVCYSFQQGYLVLGSSQQAVVKAELTHRSGESLGKSERFRAALPPGHSADASAIMYQNSIGLMAAMMSKLPPEFSRGWLPSSSDQNMSVVNALYGEKTSIHQASKSAASGIAPTLIIAAIAIPNLLRSRIAANEASAVGSMRSLNTAQVTYRAMYPENGFARDLSTLGPAPRVNEYSAAHASLVDDVLGCSGGTDGNWCTKSGYRFAMQTSCAQKCDQYVTLGTPVSTSTGARTFCSTSSGIIRFKVVPPLTSAISASECESWQQLQ